MDLSRIAAVAGAKATRIAVVGARLATAVFFFRTTSAWQNSIRTLMELALWIQQTRSGSARLPLQYVSRRHHNQRYDDEVQQTGVDDDGVRRRRSPRRRRSSTPRFRRRRLIRFRMENLRFSMRRARLWPAWEHHDCRSRPSRREARRSSYEALGRAFVCLRVDPGVLDRWQSRRSPTQYSSLLSVKCQIRA